MQLQDTKRRTIRTMKCCTSFEDARGSDLGRMKLTCNKKRYHMDHGSLYEPYIVS